MTSLNLAIGLFFAGLMLIFAMPRLNKKPHPMRRIEAVEKLKHSIGMTVESGTRIHLSLGNADILSPANSSAFAGLSVLERIALISERGDREPLSTSGNGSIAILSQSVFNNAVEKQGGLERALGTQGQLSGVTPLSYAAGAIRTIRKEQVSSNLFIGNFGSEVGLLTQASNQCEAITLGASDSLPAQAVLFASTDEPLIGEELYALPAYLKSSNIQIASLRVQDFFRWVLIIAMLAGAVLKFLGFL
jgi:hypothetical protein